MPESRISLEPSRGAVLHLMSQAPGVNQATKLATPASRGPGRAGCRVPNTPCIAHEQCYQSVGTRVLVEDD
jgi:hypothetical protein